MAGQRIISDDSLQDYQEECPETPDFPSGPEVVVHHEPDTVYVDKPGKWDILADRGGEANRHPGNKRFRKIVSRIKPMYRDKITSRKAKTKLSKHIVGRVRTYGGRFLKKDPQGRYVIMKEAKTIKKASQALRENEDFMWTCVDVEEEEAFYEEANRIAKQGTTAIEERKHT